MTTWSPTSLFNRRAYRLGEFQTHAAKGLLQHYRGQNRHVIQAEPLPLMAHNEKVAAMPLTCVSPTLIGPASRSAIVPALKDRLVPWSGIVFPKFFSEHLSRGRRCVRETVARRLYDGAGRG